MARLIPGAASRPATAMWAAFGRRAAGELLYAVVTMPVAVLGFGYAMATLVFGTGLAVTAAGIPLLAVALIGARRFGGLYRGLAGRLLGERVPPPAPHRPGTGFYGRVQAVLGDAAGWRAMAYLLLRLPVALLHLYVILFTWGWGFVALTYPLQHAFGLNEVTTRDEQGMIRHGFAVGGLHLDTWPRALLVSVVGAVLLFVAPTAVRAVVLLDRTLIRRLLGDSSPAERIRTLEETRARAVDDAAATLRRIERDLHDGAQARLVALTMQLTLLRETAPEGPVRDLATAAQATAREAVTELRELVRGIHPPVLDSGLDAALASLVARAGLPVELRADIPVRPTAAIESIAYFCAAELLTNVIKHSGATRAEIEVVQRDDRLRLRVRDDGAGGAVVGAGSGLSGLAERIRPVDGRLEVDSPAGGPTVISIELPSHA
ncbi:sensor histidine kinase [Actinoallomurus rhizosphaericola]|uniref:sensor histidine kinase n=1 Tax=Actinoallomurus rhizosphaericola TaxID=2952536 RepID=UPI0020912CFD|nr:sensor histidine kinase [Actinoallomurus rhizosphaericola]MCO5994610.1 sensor domain-containing protein [Actinoallomurus rhizosphaericola]